jgi:hypothetical protein
MKNRLNKKELDALRTKIAFEQGHQCSVCKISLHGQKMCLDHDHKTGRIRSVLCLNCNGLEGKILNLCRRGKRNGTEKQFLKSILGYWEFHSLLPRDEIHPLHRSDDEKREMRNKKARKRRQAKKG